MTPMTRKDELRILEEIKRCFVTTTHVPCIETDDPAPDPDIGLTGLVADREHKNHVAIVLSPNSVTFAIERISPFSPGGFGSRTTTSIENYKDCMSEEVYLEYYDALSDILVDAIATYFIPVDQLPTEGLSAKEQIKTLLNQGVTNNDNVTIQLSRKEGIIIATRGKPDSVDLDTQHHEPLTYEDGTVSFVQMWRRSFEYTVQP